MNNVIAKGINSAIESAGIKRPERTTSKVRNKERKTPKLHPQLTYYLRRNDRAEQWLVRLTPMTHEAEVSKARPLAGAFLNETCWDWDLFNEAVTEAEYRKLLTKAPTAVQTPKAVSTDSPKQKEAPRAVSASKNTAPMQSKTAKMPKGLNSITKSKDKQKPDSKKKLAPKGKRK